MYFICIRIYSFIFILFYLFPTRIIFIFIPVQLRSAPVSATEGPAEVAVKEAEQEVPTGKVWAQFYGAKWVFPIALFASAINGGQMPVFGYFMAEAIVALFEPSDKVESSIVIWSILFAAVGVGALLAQWVQSGTLGYMGALLAERLRGQMFRSLLRQDQGWLDLPENATGKLTTELSTDTYHVKGAVSDSFAVLLQVTQRGRGLRWPRWWGDGDTGMGGGIGGHTHAHVDRADKKKHLHGNIYM